MAQVGPPSFVDGTSTFEIFLFFFFLSSAAAHLPLLKVTWIASSVPLAMIELENTDDSFSLPSSRCLFQFFGRDRLVEGKLTPMDFPLLCFVPLFVHRFASVQTPSPLSPFFRCFFSFFQGRSKSRRDLFLCQTSCAGVGTGE